MCKSQKKSWKTLRKSVWENGEKFSSFLRKRSVYAITLWNVFGFHKIILNKINMFYTYKVFGYNLLYGRFYTVST